jgi:lipopolysaccharide transport system ATP-binding protein
MNVSDDVLVKAENVSKKFCRSLKRSLWYGMNDIGAEMLGRKGSHDHLRRNEFWAVSDVSFELRRGECLGLIGRNGAGKTTLLKMLNGLIKPDKGQITMRGRVGALIALGAGFNPILSGRENIYVNGAVLGLSKREIDAKLDEIVDFADIGEFIDAPVQSYSSGMAVRLGFAVASALEPQVLLLDEVLAVGDASFQARCFNRIGDFRRNGAGFILVSHSMHQITRFCDRTIFMSQGRSVYGGDTGTAVDMFQREMAQAQHLITTHTGSTQVMGSGAVTIERVYFLNEEKQQIHEIRSREPVTLCVEFRTRRDGVLNPILDVTIRDSGDLWFQATSKSCGCEFGRLPESGIICVRFTEIPANNQNLQVNMAMWDSTFTELFDWRQDNRLLVIGNPKSTGRVLLECQWDVRPQEA